MNLGALTRLIESADFVEFREIALRYLVVRGYREVELADGRNDGGNDFWVRMQGSNRTPVAVAATVQRSDWQSKMKADARRAKEALGLATVIYLSSHERASVDVAKVIDELWADHQTTLRSVDARQMASAFYEAGEANQVLLALHITEQDRRPEAIGRSTLKEDAACAFALFGEATERFRQSVIEQTILSYLVDHETAARDIVETEVLTVLQLIEDQKSLITSAVDRMLQKQRLQSSSTGLVATNSVLEDFRMLRVLRERQWRTLEREITHYLGELGLLGAELERISQSVLASAGALFMLSASATANAVGTGTDPAPIRNQLKARLKYLTNELMNTRLPEELIMPAVRRLAELVSNSEIGSVLMAGELFVSLVSISTNQLERAFGVDGGAEIHLDASVAIPMLLGLLYQGVTSRYSAAAVRVYKLAETRDIPLRLPSQYLEESAGHLVEAVEWYAPLLGTDPDLCYSQNAYVAHFSQLVARGSISGDFGRYAQSLGYVRRNGAPERRVRAVAVELGTRFSRYGIRPSDLPSAPEEVRREAEEAVSFTVNELGITRRGRLLEHDAAVIAQLMEAENSGELVRIFCTWDKLHLRLTTAEGRARWQPLDPVMLGDLLVLTQGDARQPLLTTVDLAIELDEEEGKRGAAVLDGLVRIEKENMHDAQLMGLVADFKNAYLQNLRDTTEPEDLAEAWTAWKEGNRDLLGQSRLPLVDEML
ncbi:MAG TPA: hypothetical protein VMU32_02635 [Solirubrobacteraceae bacterium]|nr:hypothetical protein [Solirubrobacteraceae bacterium]